MERTDWIENRILWRLERNVARHSALLKDAIPSSYMTEILAAYPAMPLGKPVFALTDHTANWTVLTTELIASHHSGQLGAMELHNGFWIISPPVDQRATDVLRRKSEIEYVTLADPDSPSIKVWTPMGLPCFMLWNILLMFPFKS